MEHNHDFPMANPDYDDMPDLADISDSDEDDAGHDDIDVDDNDDENTDMQDVDDDSGPQQAPPPSMSARLAPIPIEFNPIPPQRSTSSRRARVEDDDDDERDRRHPSQRVTTPQTPNPNPTLPSNLFSPPAGAAPNNNNNAFRLFQHLMNVSSNNPTDNNNDNTQIPNPNPTAQPPPNSRRLGNVRVSMNTFPIFQGVQGRAMSFNFIPNAGNPPQAPVVTPDNPNPAQAPTANPARPGAPPIILQGGDMDADFIPFPAMLAMLGLPPGVREDERDDPERAQKLVDGLEEVSPGLIKRLERVGSAGVNGDMGSDATCAVCWDKLLDSEAQAPNTEEVKEGSGESKEKEKEEPQKQPKIVSLPCAHVFHADCLLPWFSRPKHTTCPTCRFNIDPDNLTYTSPWSRRRQREQAATRAAGEGEGAAEDAPPTDADPPLEPLPNAPGPRMGRQDFAEFLRVVAGGPPAPGAGATTGGPQPQAQQQPPTQGPVPNPPPPPPMLNGSDFARHLLSAMTAISQGFAGAAPGTGAGAVNANPPPTNAAGDAPPANAAPVNAPSANNANADADEGGFGGWDIIGTQVIISNRGAPPLAPNAAQPPTAAAPQAQAHAPPPGTAPAPGEAGGPPPPGTDMWSFSFDMIIGGGPVGGDVPQDLAGEDGMGMPMPMPIPEDLWANAGGPVPPFAAPSARTTTTTTNNNTEAAAGPNPTGEAGEERQERDAERQAALDRMLSTEEMMQLMETEAAEERMWQLQREQMRAQMETAERGRGGQGPSASANQPSEQGAAAAAAAAATSNNPGTSTNNTGAAPAPNRPNPIPTTAGLGLGAGLGGPVRVGMGFPGIQIAAGAGGSIGEAIAQMFSAPQNPFLANLARSLRNTAPPPPPPAGARPQPPLATQAEAGAGAGAVGGEGVAASQDLAQPQLQQQQQGQAEPAQPPRSGQAPPANNAGAQQTQAQAQAQAGQQIPGGNMPFNPFEGLFQFFPRAASQQRQADGTKRPWTLPPAPGPSLRQRIEKKEREAGLRCDDVSCGLGPSDEDPLGEEVGGLVRQLSILGKESSSSSSSTGHGGPGEEGASASGSGGSMRRAGTPLCAHTFHGACLVSAERVALRGADAVIEPDGSVEVSCPVCRGVGCVRREEWDAGVAALA